MFIGPNGTSGWIVGSKAGPAAQIRYTQTDVTGLWKDGTVPGGTPGLNSVWMLGLMGGYCCGDAGTVLQTTDGIAWTALAGTPPAGLGTTTFRAIQMADATTGWVVGDDGTNGCIYKLTFSSPNWVWSSKISTPDKLYGLNAVSDQVAFAVGDNGLVMRTTDGTTWTNLRTPNPVVTPQFNAIDFSADGTIGLAAGTAGVVYRTLDSGVTWTAFNSGIPVGLAVTGVCIPRHGSGNLAYLCGTNSIYVNTTLSSAAPAAWTAQTVAAGAYQAILFPNGDLNGVCVGGASIVYTADGGVTATSWKAPTTPPVGNYRALACDPAGLTLYAAGDAGVVSSSVDDKVGTPLIVDVGSKWTALTTVPSGENLLSIQAPAGIINTLFVGGAAGNVYHLPASSATWQSSAVLAASPVAALAFSDDLNGFAVVQGATPGVFTTLNGGTTWQPSTMHFTTAPLLRAAWENASRVGYVAGDNGIILSTQTGGQ
jgi:photosystem II stability/assembly factor-like uncharacterized protein